MNETVYDTPPTRERSEETAIQKEAAEALLDIGVSVPLKQIKLPFCKKRLQLRVTMRRPFLSTQIRIARLYLGLGTTYEQLQKMTKDEEMLFLAEHGKDVSRIVALTVCRSPLRAKLFGGITAWVLRNRVEDRYMRAAMMQFALLLGTEGFMNIIRSAEMTNPMRLRLSRSRKGS